MKNILRVELLFFVPTSIDLFLSYFPKRLPRLGRVRAFKYSDVKIATKADNVVARRFYPRASISVNFDFEP